MKKLFLLLAAAVACFGAHAEGYQVNNMSAKQTGMGHVGTAMKLNSESIFFNPAAASFQTSKFDFSIGFTGILSNVRFQRLPNPSAENNFAYEVGKTEKSDNGLSTPIHAYFNYKPTERLSIGLGFYVPNGSSMKWNDNWSGAHLIQEINLKAYAFQPTISFKLCKNFSIGAGLTINWGNFDLARSLMPIGAGNQKLSGAFGKIGAALENPAISGLIPADKLAQLKAIAQGGQEYFSHNLLDASIISAKLQGNSDVAVGINAGFLWDITDEWSFGMTWRSRLDMKVKKGTGELHYGSPEAQKYLGILNKGLQALGQDPVIPALDQGDFSTQLPLPTSVTWGVSFRPTPKWEFAVDLQWIGWSAYKDLTVTFNQTELGIKPIYSVKNYSNTLAFRFGGQYRATDFVTARMGMYVDQSPVDSNFLNPETPSMTKVSYTAGLSLRPWKNMSIDLAYCYVSTADPERTGSYPVYDYGTEKWTETFSGNYTLHANVFSVGLNFNF